ncbi:MAG: hypothetical protein JNL44_15960, partial [Gemmatimonadetes bacterium]|nr:hypothetical protein [Gemmatimonadota bacterium]
VFIATGCPGQDAALHALAAEAGAPVNVVDRPDLCDAFTPSVVDRDPVVVAIGTTGTTAIDPLAEVVRVLDRVPGRAAAGTGAVRPWVHVDAAMAGSALLLPERRWMIEGIDGADSLSWNPHKWMGTILDCSLLYVADAEQLAQVMSTNPSYLRSSADEDLARAGVPQYKDWGIPLGRRFRALKLWFHLRLDGLEAIRARLRRDLETANWLADQVRRTPGWRVLAPV